MNLTYIGVTGVHKTPAENLLNRRFSTPIWVRPCVALYRFWENS